MASTKRKVVSIVKRGGDRPVAVFPKAKAATTRNAAAKATAKAARKAALAPLRKKKAVNTVVPTVEREEPHITKVPDGVGTTLEKCLNAKLLKQLRDRKVTNEAAAAALGVHPTYLSRILCDRGEEKTKGKTAAHREARTKLVEARNSTRAMLARKVNAGGMTIEKAAKDANCSVRTMFRWCAEYAPKKKA